MSTRDQNPDSQRDALTEAGCDRIFVDKASGKVDRRPELDKALDYLRPGDTFVIARLSRVARSLRHLLDLAAQLREVDLLVLKQGIDTSTPGGRLQFHMFGAFDEFLRELIAEGTLEGLASARARGRVGGRPAVLDAHGVEMARALYEMKGDHGERRYTVQQIADRLGVSRATIYRHLNSDKAVSA